MPNEVVAQTGPGAAVQVAPKVVTPAPVTATPVAPQKSPGEIALEAKLAESEKRARIMLQRQSEKLTSEAKKEREGLGPKLKRLEEFEKREARAKLDPTGALQEQYGDDWYNIIVTAKLNGGVPTAGTIKSELEKMEEKFEARLKARDDEAAKSSAAQRDASVQQARHQLTNEAGAMWRAKSADFPLIEGLGSPDEIAAELARRCENHYLSTTKRDEHGRIVSDGEMLSLQRIADSWEAGLVALAERAAAHSKYAAKFAPKAAVVVPKVVDQQQRRTLSNDLTGSTQTRSAPANDSERRARAIAAYEARSKPNT